MGRAVWIIITVYILMFVGLNLNKNERIEFYIKKIEEREKINSLLTTIFLGAMVTIVLTTQTNKVAEQQVRVADRETSPAFKMEIYKDNKNSGYKVMNEKGMASYVTLNVYEAYYFKYGGESYNINFAFFNQELNKKMNMNEENPELIFVLEDHGFDRDRTFESVKARVKEKLGDSVIVSNDKYIELSFFDYKNERFTFQFSEYKNEIKLLNTSEKIYPTIYNITMYVYDSNGIEKQIEEAVDFVINRK